MSTRKNVTEEEFTVIKSQLKDKWQPAHLHLLHSRSFAIISKIAAAKDYAGYKEIVRAEHIPSKHPKYLHQRVRDLERTVSIMAPRHGLSFLSWPFRSR